MKKITNRFQLLSLVIILISSNVACNALCSHVKKCAGPGFIKVVNQSLTPLIVKDSAGQELGIADMNSSYCYRYTCSNSSPLKLLYSGDPATRTESFPLPSFDPKTSSTAIYCNHLSQVGGGAHCYPSGF